MIDVLNLKDEYSPVRLPQKERKFDEIKTTRNKTSLKDKVISITIPLLLLPKIALADTFGDIHGTAMTMFDGGVVLIIIFAGASWALGHRSKAIEMLIGVCCGYLLARHAIDIRDYLKSIG